ncbi:MAG: hypothetical protein ACI31A_07010 [Candidatus Limisoma sp.]
MNRLFATVFALRKYFENIALLILIAIPGYATGATGYADDPFFWNSGATINDDATSCQGDGKTYYIKIKGNVTMNGCIQVGNGDNSVTLIVEIADDVNTSVSLTNSGSADSYFRVYQKSKLIIRGKSNSQRIILDGASKAMTYSMIETAGTIEMQYTTIQNFLNTQNSPQSAIKINPGWQDSQLLGTTTIKNCTFQNCKSYAGPVLFTENEKSCTANANNTPTSCAITMTDVLIDRCEATKGDGAASSDPSKDTDAGAGWGGIIRFRGPWVGNFTMKNVEIGHCTAKNCCAGVFWNAMGKADDANRRPKLIVDGCYFHHNTAGRSGGAMRIETLCEFTGAQTEISNNTAGIMGGGIHMYGYSASNLGRYDFDYFLTDKLYIHDNTAQYGGGIGFQLNTNCQLTEGSTFNLHLNGAIIDNNHATVKGGGLYFENLSLAEKNYGVNLHLNRGSLNSNKVYHDSENNYNSWLDKTFYDIKDSSGNVTTQEDYKSCGGAVYVYNTSISHDPQEAGELTMNGNKAMRRGGAICVTGTRASADLKALTAEGNSAQDGGALACMSTSGTTVDNYSSITLGNLSLTKSESKGWGGAVFVERGKLTVENNATISQSSTWEGGGIYGSANAIITIKNATISGNTVNGCGGGIYACDDSDITIEEATISNNTAIKDETDTDGTHGRGGGLYIKTSKLTLGKATISGNKANIGAGLDSQNQFTNEIGEATFTGNIASVSGGAIYLEAGGKLNISNQASFTYNEATYGGGGGGGAICVKGNKDVAEEYISGTIQNAYFAHNTAYRGGAIEFDGVNEGDNVKFTLRNNTMEYNTANLGGALLINEAKITYEGGLIRWNQAKHVDGGPKTSFGYFPYYWNDNCYVDQKFSGFGGGIIISKDGSLSISRTHPFGIYANKADIAGNDISTVCSDRSKYIGDSPMRTEYKYYPGTVTIPNPANLNLSEFQVPVPKSAISWMEDYSQDDGAYKCGTTKQAETQHYRYEQLLNSADSRKDLAKIIVDTEAEGLPKYLHLTLGYNFIFVKIVKQGLREGETAIFNISNKENSTYKKYMTIAFTGKAGGDDVERIVALTVGDWRIEETNWSYTYNQTSENPRDIELTTADANQMPVITFTNAKKDNLTPNAEAIKQNQF